MRVGRILTARPVVKGARSGTRRRNSPGPSSVVRSWPKAASFAHVSSFLWPLAFTAATGRRSSLQRPGSRLSDAVELRYVQNDDVAFSLFLVLGLPRSPGRPRWDRSGRNRRDPRPRRRAVTARRRRRQARAREGGAGRVRARHRRRAGERRRRIVRGYVIDFIHVRAGPSSTSPTSPSSSGSRSSGSLRFAVDRETRRPRMQPEAQGMGRRRGGVGASLSAPAPPSRVSKIGMPASAWTSPM